MQELKGLRATVLEKAYLTFDPYVVQYLFNYVSEKADESRAVISKNAELERTFKDQANSQVMKY